MRTLLPFLFLPLLGAAYCNNTPNEICDNGIDDDGDGNVDCDDADCQSECASHGEGEGEGAAAGEGEGAAAGEGEGEGAGEGEGEGEGAAAGEGEGEGEGAAAGEGEGEGEGAAGGEGEGEGEGEGAAAGEGEGEGEGTHELPGPQNCSDGVDNDGDFLINRADPGCHDSSTDTETDLDQCQNGLDDDYDGFTDGADSDCQSGIESNGQLPDLIVLGSQAGPVTFSVDTVSPIGGTCTTTADCTDFNDTCFHGHCGEPELLERCYTGSGQRRTMHFNTVVENIGTQRLDYVDPENHPGVWTDTAFGQLQFQGWSRFTLSDGTGTTVAQGHKASFCLVNLEQVDPNAPPSTLGGCSGIDIGFADIYSSGLACQFIDITDVPAGAYTLRIETNVFHDIPELDYDNNFTELAVDIPPP